MVIWRFVPLKRAGAAHRLATDWTIRPRVATPRSRRPNRRRSFSERAARHFGAQLATTAGMRSGRYIVFDFDFDVMERFRDRAGAVRFATWLVRDGHEEHSVVVCDDARRGEIVWPERSWFESGALAS
jgi:hypothetical protein